MENVTDRTSNPFGMRPDTDAYVPGYGDANADFHVVGDHPGAHGGADTGVPFTGTDAAVRLQHALAAVDLVTDPGDAPGVDNLFLSYRHMGVLDEERSPTAADYAEMEPFFDAELRAITAHVLLPVGRAATEHVLEQYTARREKVDTADMAAMHGTEIHAAASSSSRFATRASGRRATTRRSRRRSPNSWPETTAASPTSGASSPVPSRTGSADATDRSVFCAGPPHRVS